MNNSVPNISKPAVAAIGMFDGVHVGHQVVLDVVKSIAVERDMQSAVVTFRNHPAKVLCKNCALQYIMSIDDRVKNISKYGINRTILLDFNLRLAALDSKAFMQFLRDDYNVRVLVIGFNNKFGSNRECSFTDYVEQGKELGIEVIKAPEYTGKFAPVSSSIIRSIISDGDMNGAKDRLGRYHFVKGEIVKGFQNGRKMGFPTANIAPFEENLIVPKRGVYAVKISVESGEFMAGVCNIGLRPTISENGLQSVEVNIFDFDKDIYYKKAEVLFIEYIRGEKRFGSLDELKEQIGKDSVAARKILDTIN